MKKGEDQKAKNTSKGDKGQNMQVWNRIGTRNVLGALQRDGQRENTNQVNKTQPTESKDKSGEGEKGIKGTKSQGADSEKANAIGDVSNKGESRVNSVTSANNREMGQVPRTKKMEHTPGTNDKG